jgi:coenzyme Q-binding protein COQ10
MFDLVADVEQYPQFVPLCQTLSVRKRSLDAQGRDVLLCDMKVGYKAIRESLVSRVTLDRAKMKILVEYVDGPFSHLENTWHFVADGPDDSACRVDFYIDYDFSSRMLALLMGAMFDTAFRKFSDAFVARADVVYRRGGSVTAPVAPREA